MKYWEEQAIKFLERSLKPLPQELNEIDWKVDFSEKGDRFARHLSAFSNYSGGGFLVFGINNDGSMEGLDRQRCDIILEKIGNIARSTVEPQIQIDHMVKTMYGVDLLIIHIKEAPSKPISIKGDIYESYTRSAGQTRKMNKQEIALIISSSHNLTFETKLASEGMSIVQVLEKIDFVSYFDLIKRTLPDSSELIVDALISERIVKKIDNNFYITNLGAVLFAKSFDDFKDLERRAPRVILYNGKDRINRVREVDGKKGYASGFVSLISYINALLPSNEIIKEALRKEVKIYPELAIRELVANALIHQDFDVTGSGPCIEIFDDRLEIRNPGKPLINTERLLDNPPRSRNEILAHLMRRLHICEESGTGIDKVVSECELYQLPAPLFVINEEHLVSTIFSPRPLTKMAKSDRVRACYLHACLKHVSGDFMTNESIRKRFNIPSKSYTIASKIISEALDSNFIKVLDKENKSKRHIKYVPFWA